MVEKVTQHCLANVFCRILPSDIFLVSWCLEAHCEQLCLCRCWRASYTQFSPTSRESTYSVWQSHCEQGQTNAV